MTYGARRNRSRRRNTQYLALASLLCMLAALLPETVSSASTPTTLAPAGQISWLSTGDSYSSGEGIAGTGVGPNVCAQSRNAYGPLAAATLRFTRKWIITPESFTACTGARVNDFYNTGATIGQSLWSWAQKQGAPADGRFDVITMSFGGNDIQFAETIKDCIGVPQNWGDLKHFVDPRCRTSETQLDQRIDDLVGKKQFSLGPPGSNTKPGSIVDFYRELIRDHLTQRGVLVVIGYPRLFAPSDTWGDWRGDRCNMVSRDDADMLGNVAEHLDQTLRDAVTSGDPSGEHIAYISQLDIFNANGGHSLCSTRTEWLNGVTLGLRDGSGRVEHSFHPNELGHRATAESVARLLDRRLGQPEPYPPAPRPGAVKHRAPPTQPPITTASRYDIGDSFSSYCVVAWPTAPVRSTDQIDMRMSCQGVPQQFLFVDVAYGDPNLHVTPSTGQMLVKGKIVDVSRSELGFTTLDVVATKIVLP